MYLFVITLYFSLSFQIRVINFGRMMGSAIKRFFFSSPKNSFQLFIFVTAQKHAGFPMLIYNTPWYKVTNSVYEVVHLLFPLSFSTFFFFFSPFFSGACCGIMNNHDNEMTAFIPFLLLLLLLLLLPSKCIFILVTFIRFRSTNFWCNR